MWCHLSLQPLMVFGPKMATVKCGVCQACSGRHLPCEACIGPAWAQASLCGVHTASSGNHRPGAACIIGSFHRFVILLLVTVLDAGLVVSWAVGLTVQYQWCGRGRALQVGGLGMSGSWYDRRSTWVYPRMNRFLYQTRGYSRALGWASLCATMRHLHSQLCATVRHLHSQPCATARPFFFF